MAYIFPHFVRDVRIQVFSYGHVRMAQPCCNFYRLGSRFYKASGVRVAERVRVQIMLFSIAEKDDRETGTPNLSVQMGCINTVPAGCASHFGKMVVRPVCSSAYTH